MPPSPALPFQNRYLHRTSVKEGSCFVCGKFSTAVLTHKDIDWFYVCLNHLKDSSFCKPIIPPTPPPAPVPVPKQSVDEEKSDDNKKSDEAGDKEKPDGKKDGEKKKKEERSSKKSAVDQPKPQPAPPVIKEYILDSKIFYLRESQYRKKVQAKNAKQAESQMPAVPRNNFPAL